ncbi:hypothetical protein GGR57DRAFT_401293 [Xylariaceae sp. FL1272]|nr:hypothetical protein GGR57DRAFT_401293 [Xylariaceae sp. FL1272]
MIRQWLCASVAVVDTGRLRCREYRRGREWPPYILTQEIALLACIFFPTCCALLCPLTRIGTSRARLPIKILHGISIGCRGCFHFPFPVLVCFASHSSAPCASYRRRRYGSAVEDADADTDDERPCLFDHHRQHVAPIHLWHVEQSSAAMQTTPDLQQKQGHCLTPTCSCTFLLKRHCALSGAVAAAGEYVVSVVRAGM